MDKELLVVEDDVRSALREVIDPEIGMDIVTLGLVRDVQIEEESTHIVMILTTPFCPYGPQIMEQTRRVSEIASKRPATIEMGTELWDPSYMEEGAGGDWGLYF